MLSNSEVGETVSYMEKSIFSGKYIKEYSISILQRSIKNRMEDSTSFSEYKNLKNTFEKLNWLKFKNMTFKFNDIEENMIKNILRVNPELKKNLIELMDLENEREEKIIEYIRINK
ncbi:hypothetical protein [Clostridium pasteurianum]